MEAQGMRSAEASWPDSGATSPCHDTAMTQSHVDGGARSFTEMPMDGDTATTKQSTQQIFLERLLCASMSQGARMESASPGHPFCREVDTSPSNREKLEGKRSM